MSKGYIHNSQPRCRLNKQRGWLLGVCAGLADYWRTEPAIVRVVVVVCGLFLPKLTVAAYLVAWLLLDDR